MIIAQSFFFEQSVIKDIKCDCAHQNYLAGFFFLPFLCVKMLSIMYKRHVHVDWNFMCWKQCAI